MAELFSRESRSVLSGVSYPPLNGIDDSFYSEHIPLIFGTPMSYNMAYDAESEKIVITQWFTDLIEIFDKNLNRIGRFHGPDRFTPSFEFSRPLTIAEAMNPNHVPETWKVAKSPRDMVVRSADQKVAYSRPLAFPDGFYVMYSGEVPPDERETGVNYTLMYFHYDGTPQYRYTFDKKLRGIYAVDHKRGIAYVVDKYREIYAYDLKR